MRIAILDDYLKISPTLADWSAVAERAELVVIDRPFRDEDDAAATLQGMDAIVTLRERTPIPATLLQRLPDLKYIVVTGQRYDTIDVEAAARLGIAVSNTGVRRTDRSAPTEPQAGVSPVTELVVGLMVALARNIAFEDRMMRQGGWQHGAGISLRGKTLGVLGLGNLGAQVARAGAFFGMKVLGWSPNLTAERAAAAGAALATKQGLFEQSDFISIHLTWSERTTGIVGADELGRMKPSAFLINTARGQIVDEAALLDTLRGRRIGGAALDVYHAEPLPMDHPLRGLDNVVLTPHLGYFVEESLAMFYEGAVRLLLAWMDGAPRNLVNSPVSHA